jgi:two-component system, chemotaxis family, CheB/CheR fusion protein
MNEQLQQRTDELTQANVYLDAIVSSMEVGIAVLDQNLTIQGWNRKAEDLWGLSAQEAQGKSILTLEIGLPVAQFIELVRASLRAGSDSEKVTVEAINRRGRTIQCQVTSSPFVMAHDGEIRGVILLMEEQHEIQSAG